MIARRWAWWVAVLLVLGAGCGGSATEPELGQPEAPVADIDGPAPLESFDPELRLDEEWVGDLDGMAERGVVRALVVYSLGQYFLDGATQRGATYEALAEFEKLPQPAARPEDGQGRGADHPGAAGRAAAGPRARARRPRGRQPHDHRTPARDGRLLGPVPDRCPRARGHRTGGAPSRARSTTSPAARSASVAPRATGAASRSSTTTSGRGAWSRSRWCLPRSSSRTRTCWTWSTPGCCR